MKKKKLTNAPEEVLFMGRWRASHAVLVVLLILGFGGILWKAFQLQVVEHQLWLNKARLQAETTLNIPVYRGSIYDRQGRLLASSVQQYSVYADRGAIEDPKGLGGRISAVLKEPQKLVEKRLQGESGFVWLRRNVSDRQARELAGLGLEGVGLSKEYQRFYPYGSLAGQVLGFVGIDGQGLEGIEKIYDGLLDQSDVAMGQMRDGGHRRWLMDSRSASVPAERKGLFLSLDAYIQFVCEQELGRAVREQFARGAEAVVMDPVSFEVLAIANQPAFDPNRYRQSGAKQSRNRAITDLFEPGSAFKVFLFAAAMDRGVVKRQDLIYCENGRFQLANHTIHDVHPHGWLSVPDVLKFSSNIGASKVAMKLGAKTFYEYIRAFGFGDRTGIGLPGESGGLMRSWRKWQPIDLAASGFGQSVGVTALQLTAAMSVIANGGQWKRPVLLRRTLSEGGKDSGRRPIQPSRRVLRPETARQLRSMLEAATQKGATGWRAVPEGYRVGGKTGTAQISDPKTGGYYEDRYNAVFTGFVSSDVSPLVISVVVHEPSKSIYGGVVSAPVFRRIVERVMPYLGVPPAPPQPEKEEAPIRCAQLAANEP